MQAGQNFKNIEDIPVKMTTFIQGVINLINLLF
jgi:hypothetical protein